MKGNVYRLRVRTNKEMTNARRIISAIALTIVIVLGLYTAVYATVKGFEPLIIPVDKDKLPEQVSESDIEDGHISAHRLMEISRETGEIIILDSTNGRTYNAKSNMVISSETVAELALENNEEKVEEGILEEPNIVGNNSTNSNYVQNNNSNTTQNNSVTSSDSAPADPALAPSEPAPTIDPSAPSEPTSAAPSNSAPSEPAPTPSEPTPTPAKPEPVHTHNFATEHAPTCTESGYFTCECGATNPGRSALGHLYDAEYGDCVYCGAKDPYWTPPHTHNWVVAGGQYRCCKCGYETRNGDDIDNHSIECESNFLQWVVYRCECGSEIVQ